jgi:hypothetical protein
MKRYFKTLAVCQTKAASILWHDAMERIRNEIGKLSYELQGLKNTPRRVQLGRQERAIFDAEPFPPFVTNPVDGTQSFMGLVIVWVDLPECIDVLP